MFTLCRFVKSMRNKGGGGGVERFQYQQINDDQTATTNKAIRIFFSIHIKEYAITYAYTGVYSYHDLEKFVMCFLLAPLSCVNKLVLLKSVM